MPRLVAVREDGSSTIGERGEGVDMQSLTKGANAAVTGEGVRVVVTCASAVDVSALLLTGAGRVRDDADMIFYNQPSGPGVTYGTDGVTVTFAQLPAEIERVAVTASLDGPGTFGAAGPLTASVLDTAGTPQVSFVVAGLGPETALVCVEVYRRNGAWKVRAVGQGYADGLAGIATDFGITVDDAPSTPPIAPTRAAAPTPVSAPSPATAPVGGFAPPTGRPVELAPPAGRAPAAGSSGPPVNLDKGRVSLVKRQTVSLVKTGAPALRTVTMGLGWDPVGRGKDVDLDASVIAFDEWGKDVDKIWYGNLTGLKGAIKHSGDNLTGQGDGDDEVITLQLDQVPPSVQTLVFTVNSFTQQKFTEVKNAYCRLLDDRGSELVRFDLTDAEPRTGVLMCLMRRQGDGTWSMTALGDFHDGRNVKKMIDPARAAVLQT